MQKASDYGRRKEKTLIAGIDEAGRGPLAGPVIAAAVVFAGRPVPEGLDDSKRLSARARLRLAKDIQASALAFALGSASVAEIDALNIRGATHLAMRRAAARLPVAPDGYLIDGTDGPCVLANARAVVGGDGLIAEIAAASILAKVARDALMGEIALSVPGYGFERHKGYGTAEHMAALRRLGPCPHHRRSFAPVRERLAAADAR